MATATRRTRTRDFPGGSVTVTPYRRTRRKGKGPEAPPFSAQTALALLSTAREAYAKALLLLANDSAPKSQAQWDLWLATLLYSAAGKASVRSLLGRRAEAALARGRRVFDWATVGTW